MWSQNHTAEWLAGLGPDKKTEVLKTARQSVKEQRSQVMPHTLCIGLKVLLNGFYYN